MRIDLSCVRCGRNRFDFPAAGGDEAMVTCSDCGHQVGTLGFMKKKVEEAVMSNGGTSTRQQRASKSDPLPETG